MSEDRDQLTDTPPESPAEHSGHSPDVSLLLRTHSEQRWLSREVIPVVRQIETRERLPEEQLPAASAYLEVIWAEAIARARETDAALRHLQELALPPRALPTRARRYHAAVASLREAVARRVAPLILADWTPGPADWTPGPALVEELAPSAPSDLGGLLS